MSFKRLLPSWSLPAVTTAPTKLASGAPALDHTTLDTAQAGADEPSGIHEQPGGTDSTPPPTHTPGAPQPPARGGFWPGWPWQLVATLLVVLVVVCWGTYLTFEQQFAGRIYPNIAIRGLAVGELHTTDARAALNERYASFARQPLTITYGGQTWSPDLADLGARLELDAAVAQASALGRRQAGFSNLREVAAIWQTGLEVPLRLTIDTQTMQRYLLKLSAEIETPAVDAELLLQDARPIVQPATPGRQVLVPATTQDIVAALQTLEPQQVVLRTRELPPHISTSAALAARHDVERLLRAPITLQARGESVVWSPEELAQMLIIRPTPDAAEPLTIEIDRAAIRNRLQPLADATAHGGSHPRVDWNSGDLRILRSGEPEQRIDIARAEKMVARAFSRNYRVVNLPFSSASPRITADNLNELGITELVSVGQSDFTGSAAYRVTNIKAGMRQLHGILLAPGEEFSFNENVGSITADNGFVEGYAIIENRTQLEWGGGICQDSTTMFRAAFWAGLPITERWGHSFYINWYDRYGYGDYGDGPGMDATIFTGGPDFKFVNDTGNWLLIQTNVDEARTLAEVLIYGTKPHRSVEFEGPEIYDRQPPPSAPVFVSNPDIPRGGRYQSDTARGGMTIAFSRVIKEDGVEVSRTRFTTTFKPWPNIFEVNPADMPRRPAPRPVQPTNPEVVASAADEEAAEAEEAANEPEAPAPAEPAPPPAEPAPAPAEPAPPPAEPAPEPAPAEPPPPPAEPAPEPAPAEPPPPPPAELPVIVPIEPIPVTP